MLTTITNYIIIFLASMIPFIEFLFSIPFAIIVLNMNPILAFAVASVGNMISLFFFVYLGDKINQLKFKFRKNKERKEKAVNPRLVKYYHRFGVTGLSFLGTFIFSSQLTATGMITLGSPRKQSLFWISIAIIAYSIVLTILSVFAEEWITSVLDL